ncbi:hypothetical protein BVRB_2g033460 [Beta vulgaris subsp. vulgaris]|nr:hypothetical protein BVRB_2g033460 [Beta vulgaris subsp. vulgaris]
MSDEITAFATKLNFANHCGINGVASCDGLVLVIDLKFNMWLLNPITMKIKELPSSHDVLNYPADPSNSGLFKCVYGFGYDSFSDDYKIVTISFHDIIVSNDYRENECSERFVNVYSVRNNSWKKAESSPYYHKLSRASGIYVNGCLHWVACRYSDFSDFSPVIATFDLKEERFYEMPLPSSIDFKKSSLYVEMLGGCLVIQAFNRFGVNDLWKMEEYGVAKSWSRFSISNPDLQLSRPICFLGDDQMLLLEHSGVLSEKHIMALWNLEDDTLKEVEVHGFEGRCFSTMTVVDSLVSPYCYDEAI